MAAGKTKSIYEIDDMVEMRELMAALDISSKGLKTLDDMKSRVTDELGQSENTPMWTAGQAFSILSEAKDDDSRKKQVLLNLYNETEKFLDKTDPTLLPLLQQNVSNFKEKMKHHKVQLERREYFLLVAGETGSGKSSLVNLILGEELLPYSALSKSSTICELKFGKQRKIVAHPLTGFKKTIHLKQCQTDSAEEGYLQQISPYVQAKSERGEGSTFRKIELFWPHSLLERGVVIIDSPGIGESDFMDEIVAQYLPQAFAFIYVINSENAGGFQKDRLEKLLEEVRKMSRDGQGGFLPKCALFVCNRWDQVPEEDSKEVKHLVIRKLQRCWPGFDPQTQIIYMSTMKASKARNYGFITNDVSTLTNGLRCVVLKSVGASVEFHWKWLDSLLSRIIYQAKAFVRNASRDRDKAVQEMELIVKRLHEIEKEQTEVIEDLHECLKSRMDEALKKLSEYLSSEDAKARFITWTLHEVPRAEDSWEVTSNEITKALSNRLRDFIEQWEEDNKVFVNARESLLQHFQRRYNFVEQQLQNLQSGMVDDIPDVPESELSETDTWWTFKVMLGVASVLWAPLGLMVLGFGSMMAIARLARLLVNRRQLRKYKNDKCAFMTEISTEYFEAAKKESALKDYVKDQIEEVEIYLKRIEARLPELIKADKRLCKVLRDEKRSLKVVQQLYQPIIDEGSHFEGQLAVFGITEVRTTDISNEDLDWKENMSSRLGCGVFGVLYGGAMKRNGVVHSVALKVFNEALDVKNSSIIMAEMKRLRKLDHPNIVKFYGTSLIKERNTVRIILVMEKCKGDLKSHMFGRRKLAPGKSRNPDVVRIVCQYVKQITAALTYIHEQGIVHRDLKLENILISDDNLMKVTNVGVSKPAIDMTGTLAGTHVYIAPEVFHSEMYDCKADIYSLGIMLWEMWYGVQAFFMVPVIKLRTFFEFVDGGQRPEHVKDCKQPPHRWKELMNECWKRNPVERPTAKRCYEEMTGLIAELATDTGQQQATLKRQWQMEELLDDTESIRVCAVHDANEKGIEREEQRGTINQQKHERKPKITEEEADLLRLRESLMNYDFIECPRITSRAFQDMKVDDIDVMRIAIIGPDGSGKTSLIDTLQRSFGRPQSTSQRQRPGTTEPKEYPIHNNIRLIDTGAGLNESKLETSHEFLNILSGRIISEEISRDNGTDTDNDWKPRVQVELSKCAHAVIFVMSANDCICKENLKEIRKHMRQNGQTPVTVLTFVHKLKDKESKEAFEEACQATGSSRETTHCIADPNEKSMAIERTALTILDSALHSAERFIRICKQREEYQLEMKTLACGEIKNPFQKILKGCHVFEKQRVESIGLVTAEGGVVTSEGVKVVCPPGAVDYPVTIKITLEEPFRHYGQIIKKGFENDVSFASPIINLQPHGHLFKKAVSVTTRLNGDMGNIDSYRILHGTQNSDGKIYWQDITNSSKIDLERKEVTVEIDEFSFVAVANFLKRWALLPFHGIASLLNLSSFNYTISVLFKNAYPLPLSSELSLVFMEQDTHRGNLHCAMAELKNNGFEEVRFNVSQDEGYHVYNNENLKVSIHLGEDYKLTGNDQNGLKFNVKSAVWRNTGHVIKLQIQGTEDSDARILCGRITILGEHGHCREGSFCELDICGCVKALLGAAGTAMNIKPIAQKLEVPDETLQQIIKQSWQKDDDQLNAVLQHWMDLNGNRDDPCALKNVLKCLNPEDHQVKERGQMHIEQLRDLAKKILELKRQDTEKMKHFDNQIHVLCPSILRDCCIETSRTQEDLNMAISTDNCVRFLEIHQGISVDLALKFQWMCSTSLRSYTEIFVLSVPFFIQFIKEIFRNETVEEVQTGLKGLPEVTISQLSANLRNAEGSKSIPKLLCEVCKILENLCLKNNSLSITEVQRLSKSLQNVCLLESLKTFFQSCEDRKLYTRLQSLLGSLRDIFSELDTFGEIVTCDFYDLSLSLLNFAKFTPSKLVRFELTGPTNCPQIFPEAVKHEEFCDTFSQWFWIRKESDDHLELNATANVHMHGRIGAFKSVNMFPSSTEEVIDRLNTIVPLDVKKEFEGPEHLRVTFCSTQKQNVSTALSFLEKEMEEGVIDWEKTEITKSPLTVRCFAEAGTFVSLRLEYKWQSEAIGLYSNNFVALADSSSERACPVDFQRTANLLTPSGSFNAEQASAIVPSSSTAADDMTPSPMEVLQRHAHKQFDRLEIHYHQNAVQSHNCVVGNAGSIASYTPTTDHCLLPGETGVTLQKSITAPPSPPGNSNI